MSERPDIIYYYDGTLEGLFCCIYESYAKKEIPLDIIDHHRAQLQFFNTKYIHTVHQKSERVKNGLLKKAGRKVYVFMKKAFLTCIPQKEIILLRFARLSFAQGMKVKSLLSHPDVDVLNRAVKHLNRETELLLGFLRFSEYGGVLVSVIEPKNQVLPLLKPHFCERFSGEAFLIFDQTHHQALLYYKGHSKICEMNAIRLPQANKEEQGLRLLWKQFYRTIGISSRYNPTCRRTHMPKRYWRNMTEFQHFELHTGTDEHNEDILLICPNSNNGIKT